MSYDAYLHADCDWSDMEQLWKVYLGWGSHGNDY
jgi:hypothetical protein